MILKIAIIGLGTVGSGIAKILLKHPIPEFQLVKILTRSPQSSPIYQQIPHCFTSSLDDILHSSEIDIVIETVGGVEFAKEVTEKALCNKKHVVSANKDLIATHGLSLAQLASQHGVHLLFGAAVCGGIPIIKLLGDYFRSKEIEQCLAVVNGTNNYILTEMDSSEKSFDEVLLAAQQAGFAEIIPDNDTKGLDARYKLSILANFITNQYLDINQIPLEGIEHVVPCDFGYARLLQKSIKHLAYLKFDQHSQKWGGGIFCALVSLHKPIAKLQGAENGVQLFGKHVKELYLQGQGAGSEPTASAIFADLWDIYLGTPYSSFTNPEQMPVLNFSDIKFQHTLRFWIEEGKGIVAHITKILAEFDIGIHSILQLPQYQYFGSTQKETAFVIVLEICLESQVQAAVAKINTEHFMKLPTFVLREIIE